MLPIETKRREPEAASVRLLEQREAERAALRGERGASRRNGATREGRVQARPGCGDPEAVRADQACAVGAHEREQLVLARRSLRAHLGEARGDHADRLHAGRERAPRRVEHAFARNADHREVDRRRDVGDRRVAADAADRLAATVHRDRRRR